MFTGIIQELGITKISTGSYISIGAISSITGLNLGDSVSVNGVCLTVSHIGDQQFSADTMPETLRRSNLGLLTPNDPVNLEKALTLNAPIGGHLIQGHVDATGTLLSIEEESDAVLLKFQAPPEIMKYVVWKGFICVDGISLTIIDNDSATFSVSVVQYTRQNTTLGSVRIGSTVNLEVDILAKYVEKLLPYTAGEGGASRA